MKPREKLLLSVFIALFVVIAGGGALTLALKSYFGLNQENAGLRRRASEMAAIINEGARWEERSAWLEKKVPLFGSSEEASTRLLEVVQKEASKANLTIAGRELLKSSRDNGQDEVEHYFDRVTVRLNINSVKEKSLFAWMQSLQQPDLFLGVTSSLINPSPEGHEVNCEVQVTQFYRESASRKLAMGL